MNVRELSFPVGTHQEVDQRAIYVSLKPIQIRLFIYIFFLSKITKQVKSHLESTIAEPYTLAPPLQLWDHFNDDLIIDILELKNNY